MSDSVHHAAPLEAWLTRTGTTERRISPSNFDATPAACCSHNCCIAERPVQLTGRAFVPSPYVLYLGLTCLHKLHKLLFCIIHDLSRNGWHPAFLRHPLNLFAGHRADEVRNILKPLLSLRRPCHPIA